MSADIITVDFKSRQVVGRTAAPTDAEPEDVLTVETVLDLLQTSLPVLMTEGYELDRMVLVMPHPSRERPAMVNIDYNSLGYADTAATLESAIDYIIDLIEERENTEGNTEGF